MNKIMEEKRERIKIWMAVALVTVAFFVDCFEILLEWLGIGILGLSSLISISAGFGFWVWLKLLGVEFVASPKKFATMLASYVLEIMPGLDATIILSFVWTIGITALVIMTRAEDKGGLLGKAATIAQGKVNYR